MEKVDGPKEMWAIEEPVDELADAPRLATRVSRLFAAVVDGFFLFAFGLAAAFVAFQVPRDMSGSGLWLWVWGGIMAVWAAINVFLLVESGQTIGKSIVGLRIERLNGDRAGFLHVVLLRYVVMAMIVAFAGAALGSGAENLIWLVDALFLFGPSQRCLHDRLADTRVVDA